MVDILTEVLDRRAGVDSSDNFIIGGSSITIDNMGTPVTITRDDLAKLQSSSKYVAAGATLTLTKAAHNGKTILLDTAAGSIVTLPAATGTGAVYRFMISVVATTNNHVVKVANATDFMIGYVNTMSDDPATVKAFWAVNSGTVATNSDTITLNRSTTGSVNKGEYIEIEDVATATFAVRGMTSSTGSEATPFSAAQ